MIVSRSHISRHNRQFVQLEDQFIDSEQEYWHFSSVELHWLVLIKFQHKYESSASVPG